MRRSAVTASLLAATVLGGVVVPSSALAASRYRAPKRTTTTTAKATTTTTAKATTTTTVQATTTTTAAPVTTTTVAPTTTAPPAPTYANRLVETFDDAPATWWSDWGLAKQPGNTAVDSTTANRFLSVVWWQGRHDGASWFLHTGDADAVHLRYRMRLSSTFDSSPSASDVKMPGFGSPVIDGAGACLVACGGAAADGVRGYSARSDINNSGTPGFYVYDADMANTAGYGTGLSWSLPRFTNGAWYTVDQYIRMNTPGQHDGVLTAYVDGQRVYERGNLLFRAVDTLHAGGAWFDFNYGGSGVAPATMWVDLDDIVVEW